MKFFQNQVKKSVQPITQHHKTYNTINDKPKLIYWPAGVRGEPRPPVGAAHQLPGGAAPAPAGGGRGGRGGHQREPRLEAAPGLELETKAIRPHV